MLIFALLATFASYEQWGSDERLAMAVRSDGVVLPKIGFIAWAQIAEMTVLHSPLVPARPLMAWVQMWFGIYESKRVIFFSHNLPKLLADGNEDLLSVALPDTDGNPSGVTALHRHGMTKKSVNDAVAALTEQARAANTVIYEPNPQAFGNEYLRRNALAQKTKMESVTSQD